MASFCDLANMQIGQIITWIDGTTVASSRAAVGKASNLKNTYSTMVNFSHSIVQGSATTRLVSVFACTCRVLRDKLTKTEDIWHALNWLIFRLDPRNRGVNSHWPKLPPQALHSVLSTYAPLQGFYVCTNPYPWGLLLILRFRDGRFVAELIAAAAAAIFSNNYDEKQVSIDKRTLLMSVSFVNGTIDAQTNFCGFPTVIHRGVADLKSIRDSALSIMCSLFGSGGRRFINPSTMASCLRPFLSQRRQLVLRVAATGSVNVCDANESVAKAWSINKPNEDSRHLLMPLLSPQNESQIWLSYVDVPAVMKSYASKPGLPGIRPGLYVGAYGRHYGKLQRETLMVSYQRYVDLSGSALSGVAGAGIVAFDWARIKAEVFAGRNALALKLLQACVVCSAKAVDELVFVCWRKITGDVHVPMGNVSFCALITPSLLLPETDSLQRAETVTDRNTGRTAHITHRWYAWGTRALPGFRRPQWSNGMFVRLRSDAAPRLAFCFNSNSATILDWLPAQDNEPFLVRPT